MSRHSASRVTRYWSEIQSHLVSSSSLTADDLFTEYDTVLRSMQTTLRRSTRCAVVFHHTHRASTLNAGPLAVPAANWKDDIDGPRPTTTTTVLSSLRHSSVNKPSLQQRRTGTGRNKLLKNGAT